MTDAHDRISAFTASAAVAEHGRGYLLLDVFSDVPLAGNQLAVFTDGRGLSDATMQRIARELNLSETVFLLPVPPEEGDTLVRIFTPGTELPFAGHPLLGAAVVVSWALERAEVRLVTRSGAVRLEVEKTTADTAFGRMEQPIPTIEPFAAVDELLTALGVTASGLPVEVYRNGPQHTFVELESKEAVASLRPNFAAVAELGVEVSCFAGDGSSWKTRMFAPAIGVNEDPATGSAAGPLALHLARHGRIEFGEEIEISQGQEIGRPSRLLARAVGSAENVERIEVAGSAVLVASGSFFATA